MTCEQLGGACGLAFHASTFDEMAALSKNHGMEMFQKKDPAHLKAMGKMQQLMQSPDAIKKWFNDKRKQFDALPKDK
ncbi:hypothetical protein ADICYQ_2763 [Cyclobacterium qasimii M12-11B]|nr:hypothetical protein ADICYQ_2763 [Cyclobacterium qasimii M12-11B]